MTTGLIVVVAVLVAATVFGLVRRRTDGRVRLAANSAVDAAYPETQPIRGLEPDPTGVAHAVADHADQSDGSLSRPQNAVPAEPTADALTADRIGGPLGSRATLLQFSSAFCAPCRTTRVVLADVAAAVDGVAHVEVDAESHLDLVRQLGIMRTPTTLILDGTGRIAARASGVPRKPQVIAAIGALDGSVR